MLGLDGLRDALLLAGEETQLTDTPHGHVLTNAHVFSHCGDWIVYDVRSDPGGASFDGERIEAGRRCKLDPSLKPPPFQSLILKRMTVLSI